MNPNNIQPSNSPVPPIPPQAPDQNNNPTPVAPAPAAPAPAPVTPTPSQPAAQIPSLSEAAVDQTKPGITLGIIALILSLLVAPVGFILSIIATVRGFGKKNTALGVMGAVGIALSIIVMIAVLPAFILGIMMSGYTDTDNHKIQTSQYSLEFEYPAIMTPTHYNNDSSGAFYHYIDKDSQSGFYSGAVYTVQKVNGLKTTGSSLMSGSDMYTPSLTRAQVMEGLVTDLMDSRGRESLARSMGAEMLNDVVIGSPTLSGGDIILMDASGTISGDGQSDSKQIKFKGRIGLAVNDDLNSLVVVLSFAEEYLWEVANKYIAKPATTLRFN